MPEVQGKIHGMAFRVPVPTVSLIDLVANVERSVTRDDVNNAFQQASQETLSGVLEYCEEELVSSDFKGNPASAIFDAPSTMVMGDSMVKVLGWYDNEWATAAGWETWPRSWRPRASRPEGRALASPFAPKAAGPPAPDARRPCPDRYPGLCPRAQAVRRQLGRRLQSFPPPRRTVRSLDRPAALPRLPQVTLRAVRRPKEQPRAQASGRHLRPRRVRLRQPTLLPSWVVGWVVSAVPGVDDANMYDLTIIGRVISALFDTGTVLVVFLIARRLFNERAGLLAALFTAFAVLHIQLAHFYTTEAMLTFFSCLSFLFVVRLSEGGRRRDAALAGAFFGLAMASKFSAAPMLAGFAVGVWLLALRNGARVDTLIPSPDALKPALRKLGIAAAFGFLTFAVAQPYAILDLPYYAADAYQQSQMVRRVIDFPYTRQYDGSLPFAYHLWQFSVWGVGLPLAALMWAGLGVHGSQGGAQAYPHRHPATRLVPPFLPHNRPRRGEVS